MELRTGPHTFVGVPENVGWRDIQSQSPPIPVQPTHRAVKDAIVRMARVRSFGALPFNGHRGGTIAVP